MSKLPSSANEAQLIEILNSMARPLVGAGGGFAPLATEAYIEGTEAPDGWILCDGGVHNIKDYPELAAYYASHYGESNYFGGDGVTTFAVPTRSGMPNSGVDTPDEHIVGEWRETVDGVLKFKPVYQKTIPYTTSNGTGFMTLWNNTPIEKLCGTQLMLHSMHGYWYTNNDNNGTAPRLILDKTCSWSTNGLVYQGSNEYTDIIVTVNYIKTTDTWQTVQEGHSSDGNGVFCVKATVAGDPNAHQYSTEEQVVGKWIDGSDIYERTVTGLNVAMSTNDWTNNIYPLGDTVNRILKCRLFTNDNVVLSYPIEARVLDHKLSVQLRAGGSRTLNSFVIQYTKTS